MVDIADQAVSCPMVRKFVESAYLGIAVIHLRISYVCIQLR
jgi:hypothetical protein